MTRSDLFLTTRDSQSKPDPAPLGSNGKSPVKAAEDGPYRVAFLLIPGFALMTYSCAMEPYRAANALSGKELYRWINISPDGKPVAASNGIAIVPDQGIESPVAADELFVCAGGNPTQFYDEATLAWLRRQSRRTKFIGGVAGGPFILARAGLLEGYRCTMHWEYIPAFRESFPRHSLSTTRFEIDRNRYTSAGGTAAFDMMLELIGRRHGRELMGAISEWFLHTRPGSSREPQRLSLPERYGVTDPHLLAALQDIEDSLDEPICRQSLAATAGVSVRHLERLFQKHIGSTIGQHAQFLRLERARTLLRQTSLSVLEVAVASGFTSSAHFSRAYRKCFGYPPRQERKLL